MTLQKWIEKNPNVDNWLTSVKPSSAKQYGFRFKKFLEFCGMNVDEFLAEAKEDKIKTKTRINKWFNHLISKEYADNYAVFSENIIKAFLSYFEIKLKTPRRDHARRYRRKALRKGHIKKLVEAAPHLRDKAVIVMAFQTGMAISDLLALNYKHVKAVIHSDEEKRPQYHVIEYTRGKRRIESKAVIGKDSIYYLNEYMAWRRELGHKLTTTTPLFTGIQNYREQNRFSERSAQHMMRNTVVKAGLVSFEELGDFNLYGFHAIRKAFSSVAKQNGMPFEQVEMSMGHKLPYDGAYDEYENQELIKNFQEAEEELSISVDTRGLEQKADEHDDTLTLLRAENEEMKQRMAQMEVMIKKMMPLVDEEFQRIKSERLSIKKSK